jgi:hypothetical protein
VLRVERGGFLTAKDAKDQKDLKDGPRVSDLHFSFSCSAVLAQLHFEKKLTVMFYLEVVEGEWNLDEIFGKKGQK